ncbi:relaxase, partial [Vibrio fluvialis]|nr:relaxase [Vibrio fluvialis]
MIVKFFKGDHSAVANGLEYLEDGTKRRKEKPVLLSGNPDITREWLKRASHFSKSFTYGCLSFEESDIPVHQKQQLMASFEQTLLTGLTPEQYDIVWIEHRDKGRLELNFHIVNMELTTGRSFTPYVHMRDMVRIDAWKCIANDTYGFTDPNDPSKARTFTWGDNSKTRRELMTQIDNHLFDLAVAGTLNNQQDVIDVLNKIEGVTVTRNTKSSISFTADGHQKPIRLKGELYGKSYTGIENSAEKQAERASSFAR